MLHVNRLERLFKSYDVSVKPPYTSLADLARGYLECFRGAYEGPGRYYHTLRHIENALIAFDLMVPENLPNRNRIELAIWFHDIVYDVTKHDNEEASAGVFEHNARFALGLSQEVIGDVKQMILATKHTSGQTGLTAYLVDVDLSILGCLPELFDEYEENVKKEYVPAVTTDEGFRAGRLAFLKGMLKRKADGGFIFSTPEFQGEWERIAVLNIERSIAKLEAAAPV